MAEELSGKNNENEFISRLADYQSVAPFNIVPALPHRHFFESDFAGFSNSRGHIVGIWLALFNLFEKVFNVELLVHPRGELGKEAPEMWLPFTIANQLRTQRIISGIERLKVLVDEPKLHRYMAYVERSNAVAHNPDGLGTSFDSESTALLKALVEAYERYCLVNFIPRNYVDAPFKKMGSNVLPILSLAGISPEVRKTGHHRYRLAFDETTIFRWVQGYSLTKQRKIYIPLQLVTFSYNFQEREPVLRLPISTGAAAGFTQKEAILRGILEVVERDAFMITYLKCITPLRINLDDIATANPTLQKVLTSCKRHGLRVDILHLPTDVPCHVILAMIQGRSDSPSLSVGAKASLDLIGAISGALNEAVSSRIFLSKTLPTLSLKDIPEIFEIDRIERLERLYLWATKPELLKTLTFLTQGQIINLSSIKKYNSMDYPSQLSFLLQYFRNEGIEVDFISNELHNKKVESLFSVKVIIPAFQPLHLIESLPYFWGPRLEKIPTKFNYVIDESINKVPHPFP